MYLLGWVILPILFEFIPSIYNFILLIFKNRKNKKKRKELLYHPLVTIIIPVYNSAKTLRACIKSVNDSLYDNEFIEVFCIDNGSRDDSFKIFQECQIEFSDLPMAWLSSAQGKSKALNKAIFNAEGKYIINIDSDGVLEKHALRNLISKFESDLSVDCMTGIILTDPSLIDDEKNLRLKAFQNIEFMEYCQSFLVGKNYQSETNSIFTLSGAFSSFRRSTLMKTRMYNSETLCEDAHLTFQIKEILNKKVVLAENSIFMVDPIEGANKFYTQRQRWQIGELEVDEMFIKKKLKNPINIIRDSSTRLSLIDHTLSFPKIMWFFVMFTLTLTNHMFRIFSISLLIIYILSLISSLLYFIDAYMFLSDYKELKSEYFRRLPYLALLPLYNFMSYLIRLCGILNSTKRKSSWKTNTFTEEVKDILGEIEELLGPYRKLQKAVRKKLEKEETDVLPVQV